MQQRGRQLILLASLLTASWLGMMLVHESGHALAAWLTGGQVVRIVWHPLVFSETVVDPNPHPLAVVWGGPIVGVILPLVLAGLASWRRWTFHYLCMFFAGFCLISNGLYLGLGWIDRVGDAGDLLHWQTSVGLLVGFGLLSVPLGLWMWHRASPALGFGPSPQPIVSTHLIAITGVAVVLLVAGLLLDLR
jgi:hypothetical protein